MKLLLALAYKGERFLGNQIQCLSRHSDAVINGHVQSESSGALATERLVNPLDNSLVNSLINPNVRTVQGELVTALTRLGLKPSLGKFAGRTDAGVHARLQYFQCWVENPRYEAASLVKRLNAVLPDDMTVWEGCYLGEDNGFDVRQSVSWRWYRYQVQLSARKDCWLPDDMAWLDVPDLDRDGLTQCAEALAGRHDFRAFQCPDTAVVDRVCTVHGARWTQLQPHQWRFDIVADRFLYKMIRNLVAEQLQVATGRQSMDCFVKGLTGKRRQSGQPTAHSRGLTLMSVYYPPPFQYFIHHTVVSQLAQSLRMLELMNENVFCQAAGS